MGNILPVDMSNTFLEHSFVINNFIIAIGNQIKDSLCRVLGDSVQYLFPNLKITFEQLFNL